MSDHSAQSLQPIYEPMHLQTNWTTTSDKSTQIRRQRPRFRCKPFISSSRLLLVAFCCTAALYSQRSHAFSSKIALRSLRPNNRIVTTSPLQQSSSLFMSSVAEIPADNQSFESNTSPRLSDFQKRMKGIMKRNDAAQRREVEKPANLKTVHTLLDYKQEMEENRDKIVVVRFFATWCKACKAIQPSFYRMASVYPHITFLEVPVTNENSNLHQGLEVPSLPYGHIYYPNAGLVEELKISKKYFPNFVKMVRWYDVGACGLDEYEPPNDVDEK